MENILKNLKANNMSAYFVKNSGEAVKLVKSMLKDGETISCGGSVTLAESGVLELMRSGKYNFLDRTKAKTPEEVNEVYSNTFNCDTFLTSSNALTENGELVNVDGNSNRIAAIAYGPKRVIVIVGKNKIVRDVDEGFKRIKDVVAPKNTVRLGLDTPCAKLGRCVKADEPYPAGCSNPSRICVNYMVTAKQRVKDRISVIIVDESLGY